MLSTNDIIAICVLSTLCLIMFILLKRLTSKKNKKQLEKLMILVFILIILWLICEILQIVYTTLLNINPIYFDYFASIPVCYTPVAFLFISMVFADTKVKFTKKHFLLLIIPTLSIFMIWTNDFHHLFYEKYSIILSECKYGIYTYIHIIYIYLLLAFSLIILVKYSVKNSGIFSKQAILILLGSLAPILTNMFGFLGIFPVTSYMTPITFAFTILCLTFAMFKFNLFKITPIALQKIVDKISDSFLVLNDNFDITDYNKTFLNTFHINLSTQLRGKNFIKILENNNINAKDFLNHIEKIISNDNVEKFEIYTRKLQKYFNIEITSITVDKEALGILILFKDITQHKIDMKTIKDNQEILMERERLASLGQLVGGIAHNLKTPIMSISGATEGLSDLVNEFDLSIGNALVTNDDFHAIASDMKEWLEKIKSYTEYMSDVLTVVKGQAVNLSNDEVLNFTIGELFKRIDILMKHELKKAVVYLKTSMLIDEKTVINGNINSLVQVINNMISNAIQSYNGKPEQTIDLSAYQIDNNIVISVRDYGPGLPEKVQDKLFKEMITTKGKNGTGLGLYMSYSNIKAHFHGDITFETEKNKGTIFYIILPK